VIIPTYNEAETISGVVESIRNCTMQDDEFEILISDGLSTDGTFEIIKVLEAKYDNVIVLVNEKQFQVHALNALIDCCRGEYIVRCDAHAIYPENYIVNLANALEQYPDVGNAGFPTQNIPGNETLKALAISHAMSSRVGVGVSHRTSVSIVPFSGRDCDTVLFGAWNNRVFKVAGNFDEDFIRGQDYEHNVRVRKCGLRVAQFDGAPVQYKTRESFAKLFNVIKQYASAKPYIYLKHKLAPSARSVVPLFFYLIMLFFIVLDVKFFLVVFSIYLSVVVVAALVTVVAQDGRSFGILDKAKLFGYFACSILVMHVAHAIGTMIGLSAVFKKSKTIRWESTR
jgi:succinoglycan biosynthesis protein ExoA